MDKNEKYLKQKVGNRNPYTVPAGYFDNFAEKFVCNLPEQEVKVVPISKHRHLTWRIGAVAASFCAVMFSLGIYLNNSNSQAEQPAIYAHESVSNEETFNEVVDYAMMDNEDMYAYVSENL